MQTLGDIDIVGNKQTIFVHLLPTTEMVKNLVFVSIPIIQQIHKSGNIENNYGPWMQDHWDWFERTEEPRRNS